jgi:hypothetical protein
MINSVLVTFVTKIHDSDQSIENGILDAQNLPSLGQSGVYYEQAAVAHTGGIVSLQGTELNLWQRGKKFAAAGSPTGGPASFL